MPQHRISTIAAFAVIDNARYSPLPFDPERWRTGDPRQRMRMAGDLHRFLSGKTRAEVEEMLGLPDSATSGGWRLVRGSMIGLFEWTEEVNVRIDRDTGRVTEVTFFD